MPTNDPTRIYWDSCLYIACIQKEQKRFPTLRAIMKMAEEGKVVLIASTLVIAEVVKLNASSQAASKQAKKIRDFFENEYIKVRALDRATAENAAEISRKHGLKPMDAVHIATAIATKCHCLQTYDGEQGDPKKMLAFNGKIGTPPLTIQLPVKIAREVQTEIALPTGDIRAMALDDDD
jgi:predicted nucleic acid-binding protein